MSFFSLRSLPGNCWPGLPDIAVSQIWVAYLTLDRTQWLDPAEIEKQQLKQVRALLEHCVAHVPYYRELLSSQGIQPETVRSMNDFRRIPLLTRRTWQEHFEDLSARQLPAGTQALDEDNTSGSSGVPVRILKTNIFYLWWFACYLRDLEWSDIDPTGTLACIRASTQTGPEHEQLLDGRRFACWHPVLEPLLVTGPLFGMDLRQDPRRQLAWLGEVNPNYLLSHTSNLEFLAGLLRHESRSFPRLRVIQAFSETLTPEARTRIEAAFGATVKNLYSCAEAGYLASPCPEGHGLHVHAENVLLEVLDPADQPCAPGQMGRVVLTVLHNSRTPFVRYELGDHVTLAPTRCPCGRGLPLLLDVLGKRRPMFRLHGQRTKHSSDLVHAISLVGGHYQHQVVQKTLDHVVLRVVPDRRWTDTHPARLQQAVVDFFEGPIRVDLEVRERLDLPRSGKLQSMICEVDDQD